MSSQVQIYEVHFFAIRNAEAPVDSCRFGEGGGIAAMAATSWVDGLIVPIVGGAGCLREVFARAGAGINGSSVAQFSPRFEVVGPALALHIGTVVPAAIWAFGPADAEPLEVFDHRACELCSRALRIEIFVAENQGAPVVERTLVGDPESAGVSDVEKTGRRGGETTAIRGGRCHSRILLQGIALFIS